MSVLKNYHSQGKVILKMSATSTYNSNKNDDSLDNVYWLTLQQQIGCMIMLDRLMSDQLYVVRTKTDV